MKITTTTLNGITKTDNGFEIDLSQLYQLNNQLNQYVITQLNKSINDLSEEQLDELNDTLLEEYCIGFNSMNGIETLSKISPGEIHSQEGASYDFDELDLLDLLYIFETIFEIGTI